MKILVLAIVFLSLVSCATYYRTGLSDNEYEELTERVIYYNSGVRADISGKDHKDPDLDSM